MDKICAVVDIQSFLFNDVAREVAIVSEYLSQYQELNPQINWKTLPDHERDVIFHSTKFINGFHYCPFNPREHSFIPHSDKVDAIIKTWYNMVAPSDDKKVAYKNKMLEIF